MDSIHRKLMAREVSAHPVSVRPSVGDFTSQWDGCSGAGVHLFSANQLPAMEEELPFQVAFARKRYGGALVAAAGEGGCVQLFDTSKVPPQHSIANGTGSAVDSWRAHSNSIFDIAWLKGDTHLVTASGDQMIRLWNLEAQRCVKELRGHQGSIKSVCIQPSQNDCLASCGRDRSIMLWDLRTDFRARRPSGRAYLRCDPVSVLLNAHPSPVQVPRRRSSKDSAAGVTSVLYLKDDTVLASSGHADGVIKYWDTRKLLGPIAQTPPLMSADGPDAPARIHGIVCLAQDSTGSRLIASSRNNHIYMYNALSPERGPFRSFTGHQSQSFYTKTSFSPDDSHILSGSTDNHAYIWETDRPQNGPFVLEGHRGEVTGVDWCKTDFTKLATCSDDCTVRVWTIRRSQEASNERLKSSALRKRVYSRRPTATSSPSNVPGSHEQLQACHVSAPGSTLADVDMSEAVQGHVGKDKEPESTVGAEEVADKVLESKRPYLATGLLHSETDREGQGEELPREEERREFGKADLQRLKMRDACNHSSADQVAKQSEEPLAGQEKEGTAEATDRAQSTEAELQQRKPLGFAKPFPLEATCKAPGCLVTSSAFGVEDGKLKTPPREKRSMADHEMARLPLVHERVAPGRSSHEKDPNKALLHSPVLRLPLSPARVNVQPTVNARKISVLAFGALKVEQENAIPYLKASSKERTESPSSVMVTPNGSSRKRQRTIADYFRSP